MLLFGLTGQINLGWPWVDVNIACAFTGTGWKRTLEMSFGRWEELEKGEVWEECGGQEGKGRPI